MRACRGPSSSGGNCSSEVEQVEAKAKVEAQYGLLA